MTLQFPVPTQMGQSLRHRDKTWVWDGVAWHFSRAASELSKTLSPATAAELAYALPAGGDTVDLTAIDLFGRSFAFAADAPEPVILYLNGVRLVQDNGSGAGDFTVDAAANRVQLSAPLIHDGLVQVHILVPPERMPRGSMSVRALLEFDVDWAGAQTPGLQDGSNGDFPMYYDSTTPTPARPASAAELSIYLDGVRQRPELDYTVAGSTLTMLTPPDATSTFWGLWHEPLRDAPAVTAFTDAAAFDAYTPSDNELAVLYG